MVVDFKYITMAQPLFKPSLLHNSTLVYIFQNKIAREQTELKWLHTTLNAGKNRKDLNAVMGRQNKYLYFWYQPAIPPSYPAIANFAKSSAVWLTEILGPTMAKVMLNNWPAIVDVSEQAPFTSNWLH